MDVDVAVVGGGPAGIACALAAAQGGARVLLAEKDRLLGGTLHISGGHMAAAGPRRQRARGIQDTPAAHLADIRSISQGTAREDLVCQLVEHAGQTIDWLDERGFEFAPETPRIIYGHEPYSVPRTYYGRDEGMSVFSVLRRELDRAAGERLTVWTDAPVVDVARGGDGRVSSLVVLRGGAEVAVTAAAAVLATGGFASNAELFAELEGAPLVSAAYKTSTGDGFYLARALGAAVQGQGSYLPSFGGLPDARTPGRANWSERQLLTSERAPAEIYVDDAGQRWIAEDEPSIDTKERALARIPAQTFWTVFDDAMLDRATGRDALVVGREPDEVRAMANAREGVHAADTVTALAEQAGIDPAGLASTIREYNQAVARGADPLFGRRHLPAPIENGPFYAIRNHGIALVTFAGIDVDDQFRVRDDTGAVIGGLYAVGEVIGAAATCGQSFCSGMLVTPALTFGRLLGARLASALTADLNGTHNRLLAR